MSSLPRWLVTLELLNGEREEHVIRNRDQLTRKLLHYTTGAIMGDPGFVSLKVERINRVKGWESTTRHTPTHTREGTGPGTLAFFT